MVKKCISFMHSGAIFCLLMTSIFVGCINNDTDLSVPGEVNSDIPNTFDFATTESVQLNVNYDVPEGYKVLFEVYHSSC